MATKTYPVGTKIRFIANKSMCYQARQDDGKIGEVIGETSCGNVEIFLPDSVKRKGYGKECTWNTGWENIESIATKGQQLVFSFME